MKEIRYDVIVVGAGTGGCTVAKIVGDKGYSIALIDMKKKNKIGNKVCGDCLIEKDFLHMEKTFGNLKECIERRIRGGIFIFPDDSKYKYICKELTINRHKMGQIILNSVLKNKNVKLFDGCLVLNIKNNEVFIKRISKNKKFSLKGKIIVDASGANGTLRQKSRLKGIQKTIKPRGMGVAFRKIIELDESKEYNNYCLLYIMNREKMPSSRLTGYAWIFPKGGNRINIGLGAEMRFKINLVELFNSVFNIDGTIIDSGGSMVPVRRPLPSLVGDNFLLVGDAACQTSPISGGGIYESVVGGKIASSTIIKALEKEKYDAETLWEYNIKYQKLRGKGLAIDEAIKTFFYSLPMKEQKRIISELIKIKDLEDMVFMIKFLISSISNPFLLKKIMTLFKYAKVIDRLYDNYPDGAEKLTEWQKRVDSLFDKIYHTFD